MSHISSAASSNMPYTSKCIIVLLCAFACMVQAHTHNRKKYQTLSLAST